MLLRRLHKMPLSNNDVGWKYRWHLRRCVNMPRGKRAADFYAADIYAADIYAAA